MTSNMSYHDLDKLQPSTSDLSATNNNNNNSTADMTMGKNKYQKYKPMFIFSAAAAVLFFIIIIFTTMDAPEDAPFLTILQFNDVYEIGPVANSGGFARIKTIYEDLLRGDNGEVWITLPGDFYSPSALGIAPVSINGAPAEALDGRHMVDVLNHLGCPQDRFFATYGNHEVDVGAKSFYNRVQESKFTYIATNVQPDEEHSPKGKVGDWGLFPNVVPYHMKEVNGVKVALISASIETPSSYLNIMSFQDTVDVLKRTIASWKEQKLEWDVLICLTHWSFEEDSLLAVEIPELDILIGGHEHENILVDRSLTPLHKTMISKADSNAKSVYIHRFYLNKDLMEEYLANNKKNKTAYPRQSTAALIPDVITQQNQLLPVGSTIKMDVGMNQLVNKWTELGFAAFAERGLDPAKVMCKLTEVLNAQDKTIRSNSASPVGKYITQAFLAQTRANAPDYVIPADRTQYNPELISLLNIGSVRIDDYLLPGDLHQYDALRLLPFGGSLYITEVTGAIFKSIIDRATAGQGTGMWLGYDNNVITCPTSPLQPTPGCNWTVKGEPIQPDLIYTIILPSYIVEKGWASWFAAKEDFVVKIAVPGSDQQHALIDFFAKQWPIPTY